MPQYLDCNASHYFLRAKAYESSGREVRRERIKGWRKRGGRGEEEGNERGGWFFVLKKFGFPALRMIAGCDCSELGCLLDSVMRNKNPSKWMVIMQSRFHLGLSCGFPPHPLSLAPQTNGPFSTRIEKQVSQIFWRFQNDFFFFFWKNFMLWVKKVIQGSWFLSGAKI